PRCTCNRVRQHAESCATQGRTYGRCRASCRRNGGYRHTNEQRHEARVREGTFDDDAIVSKQQRGQWYKKRWRNNLVGLACHERVLRLAPFGRSLRTPFDSPLVTRPAMSEPRASARGES